MTTLNTKSIFGNKMPAGVGVLFCIQIVSTLSFSVLYSTLVLYMRGKLGLSAYSANSVMGVFVAFNFALHLLGGYWGGRLLSYRGLFSLGMVTQVLGCFLLSFSSAELLYYGLGAFLTGSGLNVTCLNCMLTQRFEAEDSRRETAFLWNYAGMNIGFFVGFSLSGYYQLTQNYQTLFLLSSLGNVIALLLCLGFWKCLEDKKTNFASKDKENQKKSGIRALVMICLLPLILSQLLSHSDWSNKLVLVTGIAMLFIVYYLGKQQNTEAAKNKLFAFMILMVVSVVFWMLYQIGPMGLTNFINYNVARELSYWVIPPQWFQNVNTLAIVVGGPLLGLFLSKMRAKGIPVKIPAQFALALLLIGLAFAILPLGIMQADANGLVHPLWIVLSFILQSAGELLISPIGYAMIGALAPVHLQGILMGIWMLTTGVGATLSSYSSNWMTAGQDSTVALLTNPGYSKVFFILGMFAIAASLLLYFLMPELNRLMQKEVGNEANLLKVEPV